MRSMVNLFLFIFPYVYAQDPVINLPQGRVVGIKVYAENSQTPVEIFFGIPYAAPPTGRLRFSPPERHTGWRRTLFAHRMPPRCPEPEDNYNIYNEDCLYLNIWTTRSIMARGNLGLLDQYMALLWIRENIASFGGDPAGVTLLGHSAGADSVLLHIFSPRSIGLFHRAIIMSPSHKTLWKTIENDVKKNNVNLTETISREVAATLGCGKNTDREILQCMKGLSLQDFATFYSNPTWINALQPTPDTFLPESEQYMPLSLSMALAATKTVNIQLDLLMGFTDLETISLENKTYDINFKNGSYSLFGYTRNEIIPDILAMLSLEQSESIPLAINWEYFGANSRKLEKDLIKATESLSRMETSAKWGAGIALLAARFARRVSRLYVYRYLQPSRIDLHGRQINYTGAVHGADLLALLGDSLILQIARRPSTQEEKQISTRYRRYIVNFIKFGSPSNDGEWPRYVTGDSNIFDIYDKETTNTNANEINQEIAFWLQYLPQLSQSISSFRSEKIVGEIDPGVTCTINCVLLCLVLSWDKVWWIKWRVNNCAVGVFILFQTYARNQTAVANQHQA